MPSVFSIFGELKADTAQFQNSLRAADALLTKTAGNIDKHAQGAINLGKTTAVTARSYEKLQEKLEETRNKLQSTTSAFARGEATAKQMASALNATEKAAGNINSRLLDSSARLVDWKTKADAASGASKAFSLESLNIASSIGNVVTGLSNAAAGIANFVSFVFDGTKALFNFVKVASDFGSEIKDFQDKTGLGAEAITTIKFAAEQTGKSLEDLSAPIGKFSKLLGEAADGSVKASKTLEKFGLDPKTAVDNLEGSLDTAVKKLLEYPEGAQRAYAATQLFGRGGIEVVGVLKNMDGGLNATIERARELGITLTQQDVKAADDFGDTLGLLGTQIKVLGSQFALQFAPDVTRGMNQISRALADNRDQIKAWGTRIEEAFSGAISWWNKLADAVKGYYALQDRLAADHPWLFARTPGGTPGFTGVGTTQGGNIAEQLIKAGQERNRQLGLQGGLSGTLGPKFSALAETDEMKKYFDTLEKGSDRATASTKKLKDSVVDLNKLWTSSSLAQFVKAQGFIPGAGFETTGHNVGIASRFGPGFGRRAKHKPPHVDQIVDLMVKSIQAGIRVVDERVRPPGQAVHRGPHIHLEENDNKPSFFNPNLDFGGKLDLLKALDAERIAGKGKSISSTLRQVTEDAIRLREEGARKLSEGLNTLDDAFRNLLDIPKTEIEKLTDTLAGPNVQAALDSMNPKVRSLYELLLNIAAVNKDIGNRLGDFGAQGVAPTGTGGTGTNPFNHDADGNLITPEDFSPPPPPQKTWENFWTMMNQRLLEWRGQLPSIKTAIGENLVASIQNIGNVFANAVDRWDGTAKGFFLSVAEGFKQMAKNIIADLIRIAIQALITKVLTAAFGGGFGGGASHVGITPDFIANQGIGLADGGMVKGSGGPRSDSVFARLSPGEFVLNAKAVSKLGTGFLDKLNNSFSGLAPMMAFAGGGYVGAAGYSGLVTASTPQTSSDRNTPVQPVIINQHFHANENGNFAKESATQAAKRAAAVVNRTARQDNGWPS
jgi:hypothetical protein